jgi:acyl-CoA thioesterase-1
MRRQILRHGVVVLAFPLLFAAGVALAGPIQIVAVGTSATNCKGIPSEKNFPSVLESLLRADGIDATVKNEGVNGDKPIFMLDRMKNGAVTDKTQFVIFEPGPNETNVSAAVEYTEKGLAWLQEKHIPTIYVSFTSVQPFEQAKATAAKYGATYYGFITKDVPKVPANFQADGHMTVSGCELWAKGMFPLIRDMIRKAV